MDAELSGYYAPRPTYFVRQGGTINPGDKPVIIEPTHRREGDVDPNPIVGVLIQNVSSPAGVLLAVLDESNAVCAIIDRPATHILPPVAFNISVKLKLLNVTGAGNPDYVAMIFYAKPLGR